MADWPPLIVSRRQVTSVEVLPRVRVPLAGPMAAPRAVRRPDPFGTGPFGPRKPDPPDPPDPADPLALAFRFPAFAFFDMFNFRPFGIRPPLNESRLLTHHYSINRLALERKAFKTLQ